MADIGSYMAEKYKTNQTIKQIFEPKAKLNQTKCSKIVVIRNLLITLSNFIFYSIKIRPEMAEIGLWMRKTKPTKANLKP